MLFMSNEKCHDLCLKSGLLFPENPIILFGLFSVILHICPFWAFEVQTAADYF